LGGQGEELANVRRADLTQGLEQPLDHRAEQLVRLEVEGRPGQPRVTAVQQGGTQEVQPADGPVQQGADDRLRGRVAGQLVQVALDGGAGAFLVHSTSSTAARRPSAIVSTLWHPPPLSKAPRERWTGWPRGSDGAGKVAGLSGISEGSIMSIEHVENLIIGSGVAGKILAWTLASQGQKTVVVERAMVGGSCPNVACLPSKNVIYSAKAVSLVHPTQGLGVLSKNRP